MTLTREYIENLLETNDVAIGRALLVLHANQTNDEQVSDTTRYRNKKGFRPCHARMGSGMAKFFQREGYLSKRQIRYWRVKRKDGKSRIAIYWKQLMEAAEEKAKQDGKN